jgi:Fe-S cluster assembly protein SufD
MTQHRLITKTAAESTLAEQFAVSPNPGANRAGAFAAFAKSGLPTRRDEAWHYTDLRSGMKSAAPLAPAPDAKRIAEARELLQTCARIGDVRLVLVDGRYVAELSDRAPDGLNAGTIVHRLTTEPTDAVIALNDAFARDGLTLLVNAAGHPLPSVEIVHCAQARQPQSAYSQVSVTLFPGARARIIERFLGAGPGYQRNVVTRLTLGASTNASLVSIIDDDAELHVESQIATLAADSSFDAFALVAGGAFARRQIFVRQHEAGAKIALGGLALLQGKRHADTTLLVRHAAPRGVSREYYKHIVADQATGVYQGKVIVAPHAQKTDGGMKSQAILLSPTAAMSNKPELEIFADDVVCGHGATVGALDPEQLFYLQARGLARADAESMLLEAFGADAIDRVADEAVAGYLRERMRAWLAARG